MPSADSSDPTDSAAPASECTSPIVSASAGATAALVNGAVARRSNPWSPIAAEERPGAREFPGRSEFERVDLPDLHPAVAVL